MTRIYLVDDHAIVRDGLRAVLQGAGHEVVGESGDAATALAQLPALRPEVLLLDMKLGSDSGLALLPALQLLGLPMRVLVLTMSTVAADATQALRHGALGYVLKGSPAPELLAAVATVAQGRRYLGQGVADLMVDSLTEAPPDDLLQRLSPRERQIVRMVVMGRSSAAIGSELGLSPKTVDTYRSRLMAKLGVSDLTALVRLAVHTGLVGREDG